MIPKTMPQARAVVLGTITGIYEEVHQCGECGFLYYNFNVREVSLIKFCPTCNAARYTRDSLGFLRPNKCILLVSLVKQIRAFFRHPDAFDGLFLTPPPVEEFTTHLAATQWFHDCYDVTYSHHFVFHVYFKLNADGIQIFRGTGVQMGAELQVVNPY